MLNADKSAGRHVQRTRLNGYQNLYSSRNAALRPCYIFFPACFDIIILTMSTQEPTAKPEPMSASPTPIPSIPQKRALEDDHAPTVSSPLNPDFKTAKDDNPMARERTSRAKKESLKKRESKGGSLQADTSSRATPDPKGNIPKHKKRGDVLEPIRYRLPPPKVTDFDAPRGPVLIPSHTKTSEGSEIQFNETTDQ